MKMEVPISATLTKNDIQMINEDSSRSSYKFRKLESNRKLDSVRKLEESNRESRKEFVSYINSSNHNTSSKKDIDDLLPCEFSRNFTSSNG